MALKALSPVRSKSPAREKRSTRGSRNSAARSVQPQAEELYASLDVDMPGKQRARLEQLLAPA